MIEIKGQINQLKSLVNLKLDRVDCQQDLLDYYRWCRKNIRRAAQEEIKTNLGLNLRKKLDKLKFAQEVARRELEKLSGELMLIPSHLIEKVKELINLDETSQPLPEEEPLEGQVRLSLVKEIVDLEESIVTLEDKEDSLSREIYYEEIAGKIPEEVQQLYTLWERQTELVEPILRTLEGFDKTYINAEDLSSSMMCDEKNIYDLLESLYNFGLIYNDMPAEPASVKVFRAWKKNLKLSDKDQVYLIGNALYEERWDILAAFLEERIQPIDPKTYWEDYFEEQVKKNRLKIDQALINNIEFVGDEYREGLFCPEGKSNHLGLLCDLVELIKGKPEVITFINRRLNYGNREYEAVYHNFNNNLKVISKVKDWIALGKQKLGKFHFAALLDDLFHWSLEELERYVNRRYLELLEEQSNQRSQTYNYYQSSKSRLQEYFQVLGLTINATVDEVKKQYRKLARQFHPDLGGNEDDMKKINQAYEVIISYI